MLPRKLLWIILLLTISLITGCTSLGNAPVPCDPSYIYSTILYRTLGETIAEDPIPFYWAYYDFHCTPDEYEFELYEGPGFNTLIHSEITSQNGTSISLSELDTFQGYNWRVRSIVQDEIGPWSNTGVFTLYPSCSGTQLSALEPIYPTNGSLLSTTTINFDYSSLTSGCLPEDIHLQVSETSDFSNPVIDKQYPFDMKPIREDLLPCRQYHWRASGRTEDGEGPFSIPQSFFTQTLSCQAQPCTKLNLGAPGLPEPNDQILDTLTPTLTWVVSDNCSVERYQITLRNSQNGPNHIDTISTNSNDTSWTFNTPLLPATYYFWQVAGQIDNLTGPTSYTANFATGPECTTEDPLVPPVFTYPSSNSVVEQANIWVFLDISDLGCLPDSFQFELSQSADFSTVTFTSSTPLHRTLLFSLEDCTQYYLRAKTTIASSGSSPWSDVVPFFVDYSTECLSVGPGLSSGEVLRDSACRQGPGSEYRVMMYLMEGDQASLAGTDLNEDWWVVQDENENLCWVEEDRIRPLDSMADLPVFNLPGPPSAGSDGGNGGTACYGTMSQADCIAAGGTYNMVDFPPCKCP